MMARKCVAFNTSDPDQAKLLSHADMRPNFSGYIKRLIQRDMEGGMVWAKEQEPQDKGLMQGLI